MQGRSRKLGVLSLVPFIMVLGNSMLIPVLPRMMGVLHLTLFQAGLVITAFSIPAGVVIPVAGALSDRIGRRPVMVPSLILYGLAGLGAGASSLWMAHPFPWIIGWRVVQGIGAGGTYQLAMAVAGDIFRSRSRARALGLLEASNGLGKVTAPVAGSALALIVWFAPFFAYGLLSFPVAWAVWRVIRTSAEAPAAGGSTGQYLRRLGQTWRTKGPSLGAVFLAGAVVLFALFGVLSFVADVLEKTYRIGEFGRGLLIAVPVLFSAATSYVSGTVLQRRLARWARPMVAGGLGLIAVALAAEALTASPFWGMTALVAQGIGTGATLPALNTLVTSAVPAAERGVLTSLYGSVRFFGVALGPPAFALAMTARPAVFLAAAALAAVAAGLSWTVIDERQMLPESLRQPDAWTPAPATRRSGSKLR